MAVSVSKIILLEEIARVFHETGVWPVWQYVDKFLDHAGVDAREAAAAVSTDLLKLHQYPNPDSQLRLTVAGLAATRAGESEVELFFDALHWLVESERQAIPGAPDAATPLTLTSEGYAADRQSRGLTTDSLVLNKTHLLLSVEFVGGGFNASGGSWSTTVDERIRRFRGVASIGDYVSKSHESSRTSAPATTADTGKPESARSADVSGPGPEPDPSRVFVVHGRNTAARDAVFAFLRALGLRPIEWSQAVGWTAKGSPYIGEVLDAAFSQARAVVVLMTPDEIAYLRTEFAADDGDPESKPAAQARPNVLFEAGMAMGRNSARTILVELGDVRPFSDIGGRHAIRLDSSIPRRKELAQRLQTAGCAVDMSGDSWLAAGDFTPPPPPGNGLPLGKRLPPTAPLSRVALDLRYHERGRGGRLEIINRGTETVFDIDLVFPADVQKFHIMQGALPLAKLPPGKSAKLIATRTMGRGADNFDVRVTGRTADNTPINEDVFLSLLD